MLSAPLLKLGRRLWALLRALTVLTHALIPLGPPFEAPVTVRHGSAFSAATAETAVAPANRLQIQRAVVPRAPQTAPPAPQPLALLPAPRAPPLS